MTPQVWLQYESDNNGPIETLATFTSIKAAEQAIAQIETYDPYGVHSGAYGISANETADAIYLFREGNHESN